jgi:hypothetical protein
LPAESASDSLKIEGGAMDKFIARLNIEHLRKRLTEDIDGVERETVTRLLAEEEAKLERLLANEKRQESSG